MLRSRLIAMLLLVVGSLKASPQSIEGVWRTEGWASLYEIYGTELRSFEVTSTTCVPGFWAKRIHTASSENGATFRSQKGDVFYIFDGEDENHKQLQRPGGLISITLTQLSELPKTCSSPTPNTPLGNFDVFAKTFSENYIAFDLRHIDWDQTVAQQRAKITAQTTPTQLFEILKR